MHDEFSSIIELILRRNRFFVEPNHQTIRIRRNSHLNFWTDIEDFYEYALFVAKRDFWTWSIKWPKKYHLFWADGIKSRFIDEKSITVMIKIVKLFKL